MALTTLPDDHPWIRYAGYLVDLANTVAPPARVHIPNPLLDPGFAISYSDPQCRQLLRLTSASKCNEIQVSENPCDTVAASGEGKFTFLGGSGSASLERFLFPNVSDSDSPSLTIDVEHVVLEGLAFSNREYNEKYWRDAPFYRNVSGNIPFRVKSAGAMLGSNLLHGFELSGEPQQQLIEYLRVFGSPSMLPTDNASLEDLAFNDFRALALGLRETTPTWSFSMFLKELIGPVERNVLLLGPYNDDDLESLKLSVRTFGYEGFMLRDAPDLAVQSNLEKLYAAIMCCRFVIVLDTRPSGHLHEISEMLQKGFRPVIVLRYSDSPSTWFMEDQIRSNDSFRIEVVPDLTSKSLRPAIAWANARIELQIEAYNRINHWRGA